MPKPVNIARPKQVEDFRPPEPEHTGPEVVTNGQDDVPVVEQRPATVHKVDKKGSQARVEGYVSQFRDEDPDELPLCGRGEFVITLGDMRNLVK